MFVRLLAARWGKIGFLWSPLGNAFRVSLLRTGFIWPRSCNTVIISFGSRKAESYRQVFDPLIHIPWLTIDWDWVMAGTSLPFCGKIFLCPRRPQFPIKLPEKTALCIFLSLCVREEREASVSNPKKESLKQIRDYYNKALWKHHSEWCFSRWTIIYFGNSRRKINSFHLEVL